MAHTVSIIIPAWNQIYYTRQCIESILKHTVLPYELILVDNGSTDGTGRYFPKVRGAKVIRNPKNLGFVRAINQGIARAAGNYLLFLNNDTIVTPRWLELLLNCLESSDEHGAVGPRSNFAAVTGFKGMKFSSLDEIQNFARNFNKPDPEKWFSVEWLPGFCLLVRRKVLNSVGLLDENFLLGLCEDVDFGRRISKAGYRNICAGDTFVYHHGSRTFTGQSVEMEKLLVKNTAYLQQKWRGE